MTALWMTPSYTTRTWPYREMPALGDTVRYMNDGFDVRVDAIRATRIVLSDGTIYRRRVQWSRINAWITQNIPQKISRSFAKERSNSATPGTVNNSFAPTTNRPLRPTTHYVHHVKII